jgi:DNA-binding NtrC family response regulator
MKSQGKVYVVDDEPDLRQALKRVLLAEGLEVEGYGSAADFLAAVADDAVGCLVLDLSMPGVDGLQLQQRLTGAKSILPIVFLTGRGDIPASVQAIKAGAVDFLTKPVKRVDLLRAAGDGRIAGSLRAVDAARARSVRSGDLGTPEQGHRRAAWHHGADDQGASRARDGKARRDVGAGAGPCRPGARRFASRLGWASLRNGTKVQWRLG